MKARIFTILAALILSAVPARSWPAVFPTGTTIYNPDKANNGYTLFTPLVGNKSKEGTSTVFLINMNGEVVHRWRLPFFAVSGQLLPNGNLLFLGQSEKQTPGRPGIGKFWMGGAAGMIVEMTWDGKIVFQHEDLNMHHDVVKLPNGHYLYLAWEQVSKALQSRVRGGVKGSEFSAGVMFNDYLVEVDDQGQTVWEWHASAHLNPDLDIIGPFYKRQAWCHINSIGVLKDGNLALTSRQTDAIIAVDRKTGNILWRWGNATYLDKSTGHLEYRSGTDMLAGPHNVTQIPPDYPGAGHLLCYDNGLYDASSRVVEIDPATKKIEWESARSSMGRRRFSWFSGSGQRLPNGNTLICDGANGRFYQETPSHELVWEYVSPYITVPALQGALFRAHQYQPEYCPQFKELPPARGAAVVPTANALLRVPQQETTNQLVPNQPAPAQPQPDLVPLPVAVAALAILASLLAFLLWKKQSQR